MGGWRGLDCFVGGMFFVRVFEDGGVNVGVLVKQIYA